MKEFAEAVAALRHRAEKANVEHPYDFAEEYVRALMRQGWRPRVAAYEPIEDDTPVIPANPDHVQRCLEEVKKQLHS